MNCFKRINLSMENQKKSKQRALKPALLFQKRQYVLTIGDDGAIIIYMRDEKLENRLFVSLSSPQDIKKMQEILEKDPKAPISIIVDIMDQSYVQHSLPAVSSLNIGKLVDKKLEKDFPADNLKGVILLGRSNTGRKDWNYLFVACPTTSPLSDWIELIIDLPNRITGIYLLPIELGPFIEKLQKNSTPKDKKQPKEKSRWQLVITHNKVGGFRQAAYRDSKIVFTRLVNAPAETSADIIAGNIEQELLNTIEYLRRLGFQESEGFDVTIIASPEITQSLSTSTIKGNHVSLLTPHDAALLLGLPTAASPEDRFADVIIAATFSRMKHILRLHIAETRTLYLFSNLHNALVGAFCLLPLLLIGCLFTIISTFMLNSELAQLESDKATIQAKWQNAQQNTYSIQESLRISDMVTLYKLLSGNKQSPLTIIADFNSVRGREALVKNLLWEFKEVTPQSGQPGQTQSKAKVIFDLEFANVSSGFEGLFANFDLFIKRVQTKFSNYQVDYSRLPEKITFDDKNKTIPVSVTISGPNDQTDKSQ